MHPQPASSVVLVRERDGDLEVFMMRRAATMAFVPGMYVFPGGRVDAHDFHDGQHLAGYPFARDVLRASADESMLRALVACAVRELDEETGVRINASDLTLIDHWVTPEASPMRYDVRFFLAALPDGVTARGRGTEMDQVLWIRPVDALRAGAAGEMPMLLPTQRVLEFLSSQSSITALTSDAHQRDVKPMLPERGIDGHTAWRIVHAVSREVLEQHDALPDRWEGIDLP